MKILHPLTACMLIAAAFGTTTLNGFAQDKPCHHNIPTKSMSDKHDAHGNHANHSMADKDTLSTQELKMANDRMHKNMSITYSGDVDVDFLKGMIAHHQGAVDMAQVQMKYGKDAQVRRLSQDIIRAQNIEIRWMKRWLAQLEAMPLNASNTPVGSGTWHDEAWAGKTWLNER